MFDKMIVSDAGATQARNRTRYFIVTGLIVGTLFFSAVVISIYAVDLDLGNGGFELSMMLAPVAPVTPETPEPKSQKAESPAPRSDVTIRNQNIQRPEEQPVAAPESVSVSKNPFMSRPAGKFLTGDGPERNGAGVPDGLGRGRPSDGNVGSSSAAEAVPEPVPAKLPEPPPAIERKPLPPKSLGVINGKATSLPKPPYPPAAIAMNAQGEVTVQVTIDENGKVISAKAIKGHPMLTREAERAAMNARFSPTTLSKVPVKVTGMIVYNFKR